MPIPFNFKILRTKKVTRLANLSLIGDAFVAWSYHGIYKNRNAESQPQVLVGFRQLIGSLLADEVILRRVPLTALGQVRIGTIWKDNVSDTAASFDQHDFDVDFRSTEWRHTSFAVPSIGDGTAPYPLACYPLKYPKDQNWYIEFKLPSGGKLVIPCLEFYARCYGRSNELNRILATYRWDEVNNRCYAPIGEPEEYDKWKIKLRKRLHNGDTVFLAHAKYDPYTRQVAKEINAQIESQFVPESKTPCFIKVAPWFQGPAELRCQGIWFDNGRSFLALQIDGCSDPDGILIERDRENTNKNVAGESNPERVDAWKGAPEKRLIRPPDIVDLTDDDEPDHGASSVEIQDSGFVVLGIRRAIVDRHGNRISSSSRSPRKGSDESSYSSGEPHGSGKGIGYASIHAPVILESHGALLDAWNAANSLKMKHPDLIQSADWFTFTHGYRSDGNPKLIALEAIDQETELETPDSTRNWCYFDVDAGRMRGVMVLRIVSNGLPIHIVEIERRPRKTTGQTDVMKESEEPYQGFVTVITDRAVFEKWLRRFVYDVRYVRGIVSKLVPYCPARADTFRHPKVRGDYVLGEPAVLNALEKMGVSTASGK